MTSQRNRKVDGFIKKADQWQEELKLLREIVLDCDLTEDMKWMHPTYIYEDKNVVTIHGFKHYCALLFHKGALLQDPHGILVQQTENVQAARQIRFTHADEIRDLESQVKDYIHAAIENEKAGLRVERNKELDIPKELQQKFDDMPELKTAFESLTPGRQRAYILYISKAKKSETRTSRVEKYTEHILDGKGLNDSV